MGSRQTFVILMTQLGRPARDLFLLQRDAVFLNHGSFGAVPAPIRAAQDQWRATVERQPDVFFRETIWTATRESAVKIGAFIGARGDSLVFLPNVTETVAVVLDAMGFQPGDEIMLLDVAYAAVRRAANVTCERTGAVVKTIATTPAMDNADWAPLLQAALTPRTRLVLLDHIVSPTAQLVPIERLIPLAKAAGARVYIDGAHAIGQLRLDISALGADWYATNCHKWLFGPRGSCVLYAAPDVQDITRPVIVSHQYAESYPRRFDYVGTRDATPYLAAAHGVDFLEGFGFDAVDAHRALLRAEADRIMTGFGAQPVTPRAPALLAWILPQTRPTEPGDGPALMRALWERAQIQIASSATTGRLLLRLSLQLYDDAADLALLAKALDTFGWPGR